MPLSPSFLKVQTLAGGSGGTGRRGGGPQTTFGNAPMRMQSGDVTQPPNTQAKFSHLSAMLRLAWQLSPKVPWAE